MRLIFLGDIVGKAGRAAVLEHLPDIKERLRPDFVIVNGENAAHGFGISIGIVRDLFEVGVDVITTGNHVWDQREIIGFIDEEPRLLRPGNFPAGTPGKGAGIFDARDGGRVLVMNVMGRLFMDPLDDPFKWVDDQLAACRLREEVDAVVIDLHAEATSEKMAMGHFVDGRATLVVGTHTHVPTADTQILDGGTAYQTDAGMCGSYNSVIGMEKDEPLTRFTTKMSGGRFEPAMGTGTVSGVFVETDPATGLAVRADPIRLGGRLIETMPEI